MSILGQRSGRCGGLFVALLVWFGACGESGPKFTAPMTLGGVEVSAEVLNRGARIYTLYCASCHAADGSGKGPAARALEIPPRDFSLAEFKYKSTPDDALPIDADLDLTVRKGRLDTGMPAWNGLTDQDRHAVIQYIKTFSPRWKDPPKGPSNLNLNLKNPSEKAPAKTAQGDPS